MIRKRKLVRAVAMYLLVQFSLQTFLPAIGYALTSGPSQPEFSSFEPVSTANMVDEFSGDFTYNLPLLEVPGPQGSSYPITLSYHSGTTQEEEASWVGYGWSINTGAINRNTRGVPDDFNGNQIKFHNNAPANWTVTAGGSIGFGEGFSADMKLNLSTSVRYNNYKGFGYNKGIGLALGKGIVTLGYNSSNEVGSFSLDVNPMAALMRAMEPHKKRQGNSENSEANPAKKMSWVGKRLRELPTGNSSVNFAGSKYGIFSYNQVSKPSIIQSYTGISFNTSLGTQTNASPIPVGGTVNVFGSYASQKNKDVESAGAFGFMYSKSAGESDVMDYHMEKESSFDRRDVFLGVPFTDADNFMVSGEGIGGGFRLYNKQAGHFGPRKMESGVKILNLSGEVGLGWTFGPGVDVGVGEQSMKMRDWSRLSSFAAPDDASIDEPVFFRFNNDLGGEWGSNFKDDPEQASISDKKPSLPASLFNYNNGVRSGRSSYIGYNVNKDMVQVGGYAPTIKAFNKNQLVNYQAQRNGADDLTKDLVGEFSIVNEIGKTYLYALPVYNRNEKSLSFNVSKTENVEAKYMAYGTRDESVKVGQEQDAPYAGTYLLTEINSSEYLDLTGDGPTADDFGGYTRFNYTKLTANNDWYAWRAPYSGLIYNKNSQSDPKDDLGSYSTGEKEIYYLQSVETKTHVAVFQLDTEDREDSREAPIDDVPGSPENSLKKSPDLSKSTTKLKRLKRIDLYALIDCDRDNTQSSATYGSLRPKQNAKPVKSVLFKYEYLLCPGAPNATSGKLTLTRVYFEYNGISSLKISPYLFKYNYPTYPASTLNLVEDLSALQNQNPAYSVFNTDAWGNYQVDGQSRFIEMRDWLDQTKVSNQNGFDPAAWNLKSIALPSGGEIHVQYEQDDYAYVQDQRAHIMAPLASAGSINTFFIDAAAVGISDVSRLKDLIKERYIDGGNKMYFKFLYQLLNTQFAKDAGLDNCNSEFITGYANIIDCQVGTGGVVVVLSLNGKNLPAQVCEDFVKTQRLGMLDANGDCAPGMNDAGGDTGEKALSMVRQLYQTAGSFVLGAPMCKNLDPKHSYFRIPVPDRKKGGGIRVKRLLTYDTGLDGQPVLYGNEYHYEAIENGRVISSGVATNEPQTIREENVLVDFIARKKQSWVNKIIAGDDLKQSEGPLGESVLPGPSVGYSRVVINNIYDKKTSPGFSITEFFTAKDYPVILARPDKKGSMTPIDAPRPEKLYLPLALVNIVKDKSWASQGFTFVLNNMHGQLKSRSAYSGSKDAVSNGILISSTSYTYFDQKEGIPTVNSQFGGITSKNPGREAEITFAQKKVEETSTDGNIELDVEISIIYAFIPIILLYPTGMPSMSSVEGELSTHSTSKVVRYPAIVKSSTTMQDGIVHMEENVAFDDLTGRAVMVRSKDEFKGAYLSTTIPASWEYPAFAPKYATEGKILKKNNEAGQKLDFAYVPMSADSGLLAFTGDVGCRVMADVAAGDVLDLGGGTLFQVKEIDYSRDQVAIVRSKGNTSSIPASINAVKILRTGRANRLTESAGAVTYHAMNESAISANTVRKNDAERYTSTPSAANSKADGSLFVSDLNYAFTHRTANGTNSAKLAGPYEHMNLSQFIDRLPEGCSGDLADAQIKDVAVIFRERNGNITVELAVFWLKCGPGDSDWFQVKMPDPNK